MPYDPGLAQHLAAVILVSGYFLSHRLCVSFRSI